METQPIRPYALRAGDGWTYNLGVDFVVKLGEQRHGRRLAVLEYTTSEDEWPGHTHPTEDEVFYVLEGSLTFRCGTDEFDVAEGSFAFLPAGLEHGYRLRGEKMVRLLVVTAPAPGPESAVGWDGFVSGIESGAEPQAAPTTQDR
jgi:quercetin dioxygenase-like cupin family protein